MRRASRPRRISAVLLAVALGLAAATGAAAYEARAHQQLTFLAAKQLNRCLGDDGEQQLSPLQVRAIANGNVALADSNFFVRLFRWNYYDPLEREDSTIAWLLDTRFVDHFHELVGDLHAARSETEALEVLGRIISYLQLVTSPARALPVYAPRFWRWTFSDRFDGYPLREAELEAHLSDDCSHLAQIPDTYQAILAEVATDTQRAVRGPIGRLPATWESFWTLPEEPGSFGGYGPAGNSFGRYTEFPCGTTDIHRCVLITDDPAYMAFAFDRQLAAVRATARAMLLFRRAGGVIGEPEEQAAKEQPAPEQTAQEQTDAE